MLCFLKTQYYNEAPTIFSHDACNIEDILKEYTPNCNVMFPSNNNTGDLVALTGESIFLVLYRKYNNCDVQIAISIHNGNLAIRANGWWGRGWSSWSVFQTLIY